MDKATRAATCSLGHHDDMFDKSPESEILMERGMLWAAEGKELVRLAEERGLWIGGAPDTFMGAGIQSCRNFIDEGKMGDVFGGRCVMSSRGVES